MEPIKHYSIGGYLFSLEDDAMKEIRSYLDELNSYYSRQESGSEIMDGIEDRFGELLMEKCGQKGVVTVDNVRDVISVLGRPEAIEEEAAEASGDDVDAQPEPSGSQDEVKPRRRLYRDMDNHRVGGVCSGLGAYFDCDPTIFRLIFVGLEAILILFDIDFGVDGFQVLLIPLIYVVLWIAMPAARTVRQKDELHGESGTVDALSARIQNGDDLTYSKTYNTWPKIERFLEVFFGVILLVVGVCGLVAIGTALIGRGSYFSNWAMEHIYVGPFHFMDASPFLITMAVLIVAVPFVLLMYLGILLSFHLKTPKWHPGLILFILWLAAITALSVYFALTFVNL